MAISTKLRRSESEQGGDAQEHGDGIYVVVALVLAALTAMEVSTYTHDSTWGSLAVPAILIIMTIKFVLVVLFFMHLKDDPKLLATFFLHRSRIGAGSFI